MIAAVEAYWPSILGALGTVVGSMGLGGMLKTLLDHKRNARKDSDEVALSLVTQLTRRIEALEAGAAAERALCDANLALLRHRLNNISGSFDGLLLLMEMAPEKAEQFVKRIKDDRAAQVIREAAEKAVVTAATVGAAAKASTRNSSLDDRSDI